MDIIFLLSEAKELPDSGRKAIAKKDYKQWFSRGDEFFFLCKSQS